MICQHCRACSEGSATPYRTRATRPAVFAFARALLDFVGVRFFRTLRGKRLKIEQIQTAYYRLPLEPMGDAGHGAIDSEELITLTLHAEGLVGHGHAYTIGRGGRAIQALIDHDLAPLLRGQEASDIQGL
jgi:hypothetical protein